MRIALTATVTLNLLSAACGGAEPAAVLAPGAREPVVGLPCENCDEVFNGMPANIAATSRIAPVGEPGEPMRIEGTVRDASGRAVAGVIVYAYQTDARGLYPRREGTRHGALRAWARSDASGRFRFDSIRPASYPGTTILQHVHVHVIEPGCCTYYVDDVLFDDDPHLDSAERARQPGRGGNGIAVPRREEGVWVVRRDIVLGLNVPGHP